MTEEMIYIAIAATISFALSMVAIPVVIRVCARYKLYDQPNARKMHTADIPRLGGVIFMPCMLVGTFVGTILQSHSLNSETSISLSTVMMGLGAFLIYLIGILDDLQGMKAWHKFMIQFVAAMLFPLCNLMINDMHGIMGMHLLPTQISYPLTVFCILLIVNAMNLIDGIDGLSSSLAMSTLCIFGVLYIDLGSPTFALLSFTLAATILGFFIFNFFGKVGKNKVFMGDTGSLFLGYVIAYLAIKYQMTNWNVFSYRPESFLISFTLVFIPCVDVIRVALFRIFNGKGMFEPDKTHIHHIIMDTGLGMHETLFVILVLYAIIIITNWALYQCDLHTQYILLIDILLYAGFIGISSSFSKKRIS